LLFFNLQSSIINSQSQSRCPFTVKEELKATRMALSQSQKQSVFQSSIFNSQ